jgi:K+-sensing histidine kinase KdpD
MDVMRLILSMETLPETTTKELDQIIDISTNSANSLLVLVASLRDIPRLGKGEMPIVRAPTSVKVLAEEARALLAASLNDAKIILTIDVPPALDRLDIDAELIRRVFVNLMHNAFKFTPEQGQIAFVVDEHSYKEGFVRVTINDTGPGIPPSMREKIFDENTCKSTPSSRIRVAKALVWGWRSASWRLKRMADESGLNRMGCSRGRVSRFNCLLPRPLMARLSMNRSMKAMGHCRVIAQG